NARHVCRRVPVNTRKERQDARHWLTVIGAQAVWKIEDDVATPRGRQGRTAPEQIDGVGGQDASQRLQQGRLTGTVRPNEAENFAPSDGQGNVGERDLVYVALREGSHLEQDLCLLFHRRGQGHFRVSFLLSAMRTAPQLSRWFHNNDAPSHAR